MTFEDLWNEVMGDIRLDKYGTKTKTYCIHNGCKIINNKGVISIYNCNTGGNTFAPLSPLQLKPFLQHGFKVGTEYLVIDNVRTEIMLLGVQIRRNERLKNIVETLKLKKRKTLLSNLIKSSYYGN